MKKTFSHITYIFIATFCLSASSFAQDKKDPGKLLEKVTSVFNSGNATSLSTDEITSGLKEALIKGSESSTQLLSAENGFYKNAFLKILLPPEIQQIEKKMRFLGMGKIFDDAVLSLNRAAEEAAKSATPIFINAIKKMTVNDALQILKGGDTSATAYLRITTQQELTYLFKPTIDSALQKTDATKYWSEVMELQNKLPGKKVNPDLTEYVTQKTLDGIFYYIGQEEKNIRQHPEARVSEILKKVFQ